MSQSSVLVEACVDSAHSAVIAQASGVDRVELCANLVEGGTTPSQGSIELALDRLEIPCAVMIRPRGGDFHYSADEVDIIIRDIEVTKRTGAFGVVLGCLTIDGQIDRNLTRELVDAARPLSVTFHRAFDMTRDPMEAVDALIEMGVDRVLTSGQQPNVEDALDLVRACVQRAGNELVVMPGGGVNSTNVKYILDATGAQEIHVYTERTLPSPMTFQNPIVHMGRSYQPQEYSRIEADGAGFAQVVSSARSVV